MKKWGRNPRTQAKRERSKHGTILSTLLLLLHMSMLFMGSFFFSPALPSAPHRSPWNFFQGCSVEGGA